MLMYVQRKNDYVQRKNDTLHPTTLEVAPLLHLARKEGSWKREPAIQSTHHIAVPRKASDMQAPFGNSSLCRLLIGRAHHLNTLQRLLATTKAGRGQTALLASVASQAFRGEGR
jgi:hypothetical protein